MIVQLVFSLPSAKSLNRLYWILCLITLCKTNFLQSVSQVSYLVTHAMHNCCQLHMKPIKVLTVTHWLTREKFFLIFLVYHEGLIFKLKIYGLDEDILKLLINYLEDCKQRIALNWQTSSWKNMLAGVPEGSVLGPILLLIYINNLPVEGGGVGGLITKRNSF